MKLLFTLLGIFFLPFTLPAQEPFFRYFDLSQDDASWAEHQSLCAIHTPDGGFLVGYLTHLGGNTPYMNMGVARISSSGTVEWSKIIGNDLGLKPEYIVQDSEGNYIVGASEFYGDGPWTQGTLLFWFSPAGELLRGPTSRLWSSVDLLDFSSHYLLVSNDLLSLDRNGNILKALGVESKTTGMDISSVALDSTGAFCIVGTYLFIRHHFDPISTGLILIFDSTGNLISSKILESPYHNMLYKVVGLNEGWLILGEMTNTPHEITDTVEYLRRYTHKYREANKDSAIQRTYHLIQISHDGAVRKAVELQLNESVYSGIQMERLSNGDILLWYSTGQDSYKEYFPDTYILLTPECQPIAGYVLDSLRDTPFVNDSYESLKETRAIPRGNLDLIFFAPDNDRGGLFIGRDINHMNLFMRYTDFLSFSCIGQHPQSFSTTPISLVLTPVQIHFEDVTSITLAEIEEENDIPSFQLQTIADTISLLPYCPGFPLSAAASEELASGPLALEATPNVIRAGREIVMTFTGAVEESLLSISITNISSGGSKFVQLPDDRVAYHREGDRGRLALDPALLTPGIYLVTLRADNVEETVKVSVKE